MLGERRRSFDEKFHETFDEPSHETFPTKETLPPAHPSTASGEGLLEHVVPAARARLLGALARALQAI